MTLWASLPTKSRQLNPVQTLRPRKGLWRRELSSRMLRAERRLRGRRRKTLILTQKWKSKAMIWKQLVFVQPTLSLGPYQDVLMVPKLLTVLKEQNAPQGYPYSMAP